MAVIIVEGPEKAGKSTLCAEIAAVLANATDEVVVRHQVGRARPDDRVYGPQLAEDTALPHRDRIAVWDRGWPSEYVYGTLLGQDRRLAADPWLGEWLYGRAVNTNGLRVMLPGPDARTLAAARDSSDLPVDPGSEQRLYLAYAFRWGWEVVSRTTLRDMVSQVTQRFYQHLRVEHPLPPVYAGNPWSSTIIVGEERAGSMTPGGWLPFSTHLTTKLGRLLGDRAMDVGWTNAHDCPPEALRHAGTTLVACGAKALQWVNNYVVLEGGSQRVVALPHPSHTFRYNNSVTEKTRQTTRRTLRRLVKEI